MGCFLLTCRFAAIAAEHFVPMQVQSLNLGVGVRITGPIQKWGRNSAGTQQRWRRAHGFPESSENARGCREIWEGKYSQEHGCTVMFYRVFVPASLIDRKSGFAYCPGGVEDCSLTTGKNSKLNWTSSEEIFECDGDSS